MKNEKSAKPNKKKKTSAKESTSSNKIDITDPMMYMWANFEVQRRFFYILSLETIAYQYGMTGPSVVKQYKNSEDEIDFENLV